MFKFIVAFILKPGDAIIDVGTHHYIHVRIAINISKLDRRRTIGVNGINQNRIT